VRVESVHGPAARAGLRAGDCLLAIGGVPVVDALDLEFAAADERLLIEAEREGKPVEVDLRLAHGEEHGIELPGWLGDPMKTCVNDCRFCFVDQMPAGLRPTLYVKDDDYRLSFLEGNFVTLSNMTAADIERVARLRLSPLYVSLHAWDDDARAALMGRPARGTRATLERLLAAGIGVHIQVVLCPGWNDGAVLDETITALARHEGVEDVGVVPVSVAQEGDLRRVSAADARAVVAAVEREQGRLRPLLGRDFVHAADEFYLLMGRTPPQSDADLQYENGIGMAAAFLSDARRWAGRARRRPRSKVALLTGTLAEPVAAAACSAVAGRIQARPYPVVNQLFGEHVTVTGLLGGREVLAALGARRLADDEWLAVPRSFLPAALGRTLDDVTESELREACGGRLAPGDGLAEALEGIRS
jgi:putative radical SAM enzyme (TIGR03279 family)